MTKKKWTPVHEAAMLAKAEKVLEPHEVGPAIPNPLRKAGRPSLSPEGGTSKALNTRIPSDLHVKVVAFARKTGRSVSDLTRDALSAFMSSDGELQAAATIATSKRDPRTKASAATKAASTGRASPATTVRTAGSARQRRSS